MVATGEPPLLAVGDVHGHQHSLLRLLEAAGAARGGKWSFGRGQVVLCGDVIDRGPRSLATLLMLRRLQQDADAAGGAVHLLLGNHERMLLLGDRRHDGHDADKLAASLAADRPLGAWLRSWPAVLKVGRWLFCHGGLHGGLVRRGLTLRDINTIVSRNLHVPRGRLVSETAALLLGPLGPLWYRGLLTGDGRYKLATPAEVQMILRHFDADHIAVGHTTVRHIGCTCSRRVVALDVDMETNPQALLVRDGRMHRLHVNGTVEWLAKPAAAAA